MLVIKVTGTATQVFTIIEALAKTNGKDTLAQIVKEREVRSRAVRV
jgi:hypothetical protein